MMEPVEDKLFNWFALKLVPGVGNVIFGRLLKRYNSPDEVMGSNVAELSKTEGVSEVLAKKILSFDSRDAVRKIIDNILKKEIRVLTIYDDRYPENLRMIYNSPPFLFISGSLCKNEKYISIVGTRTPTRYGAKTAQELGGDLSQAGFCVVSGLARGIDTAGHTGALNAGGRTVAVLGSGLSKIYPKENIKLAEKIIENGAIISEFFPDTNPEPANFPMRNRIISGMSLGTVVVEAGEKSGSLITAKLAAEQGREVFAIPGNVDSVYSKGANYLIKQGAKLAENVEDILEEFPYMQKSCILKNESVQRENKQKVTVQKNLNLDTLSGDEIILYEAVSNNGMRIDDLVEATGFGPDKTSSLLLMLELSELVNKNGDMYYRI